MSGSRRAAAVLAAVVFGGLVGAGGAEAATSDTVCATTSTPAGWVEVRYQDTFQCGPSGGMYNTKTITDANGTSPGGTVAACTYSPVPADFHVTRYSTISGCYRGPGTSEYHNQVTLVRLTGLQSGTAVTICGVLTVPSGWTVVQRRMTSDCQQYRGALPTTDNAITIRKS